jgi:hypothetical protein
MSQVRFAPPRLLVRAMFRNGQIKAVNLRLRER